VGGVCGGPRHGACWGNAFALCLLTEQVIGEGGAYDRWMETVDGDGWRCADAVAESCFKIYQSMLITSNVRGSKGASEREGGTLRSVSLFALFCGF